eukprot:scaffold1088_cov247-Pinguiococcus_pyrenoidosus.AAC.2
MTALFPPVSMWLCARFGEICGVPVLRSGYRSARNRGSEGPVRAACTHRCGLGGSLSTRQLRRGNPSSTAMRAALSA